MKTTITLCLLLLASFTFGQIKFDNKTVQPALNLKKGERHIVSIVHTKISSESGKQSTGSMLRYEAVMTVVDSAADELTIEWVYHLPASGLSDAERKELARYFEGLRMVYKTDGTGGFKELLNWEAVRDFYIKIFEESIPKKGDSTDQILEKTKAMFSTKEMVQNAYIKEIQLLHVLYGQSFSSQLVKSTTYLRIPIANDPVPAVVTSQVTEQTPASYTIKTTQAVDKVAALKMIEQMFEKMGVTVKDPKAFAEAKAALTSFEMSDEGSYTVSQKTGLPIKATYKRIGGAAAMMQRDTYELSVK